MKSRVKALIVGFGALASGSASAADVDMWDGQTHFDVVLYGWLPWMYTTVQLPPIAGGGNPTIETHPSDYLKDVRGGALIQGSIRKGDWSLWTDLVYLHLSAKPSNTRQIGLPGGDPTLEVTRSLDGDVRAAIWTLAPAYTVIRNDVGNLDVLVGLRYTDVRVSLSYQFTVLPISLQRSGGFSPKSDSTDGLLGFKGQLRLSRDAKWFLAYEADIASGNKNWQHNEFLAAGYRFHWGDLVFGMRNLDYHVADGNILESVRMTGPLLGASFRW